MAENERIESERRASEARRSSGLYVDDSWRTACSSDRFSDAEAANELRMIDELQKDRSRAITTPDKGPSEANVGALDRARATAAQGHSSGISRI
ncbi:hypothetical protein EMIHUDRAFT_454114 [Emiliania huxleyi CCMP1516]|uniref:Uncharacterized protein n=2 Tax=Emiliania huxleyi TaxID=2903 RepID=A0A0D3KYP0_EMIH1|nr:hypothetical protein EMIHUDRAFT_460898 [Emiliania huxleyi CCMP1516]XP_005793304.1 hypothetical protein EMIHUDRAFT_454114 [Emiliania huxleyi CCMP1516]EOD38693.1 hypothetical protein EMIHUDRAFT_460898 [Emiliania huxleyi CCMP1516]EOD40875.1 hypothetical protein EMIHUDRAFT_454114 [Emiliania huxleyi CCMP1516]|eukprot:XP_005791122.1 hypothetical protein EMIHUDRAFT_460898 [Emiliania huxleyi CCMP1516]